jgi:ATP-dependent DNA helicase RecG
LALGEDSRTQFKAAIPNAESLAAELVAFSNGTGGTLFVGARDDGSVAGLRAEDIRRLNLLISNAASQGVRPAVNPLSENIATAMGIVVAITVLEGASKPYMDKDGVIWVKSGADKRRATSREEIQRMFQNSGLIHGDEIPVRGMTIRDIDLSSFGAFYEKLYGGTLDTDPENFARLLRNMNLSTDEWLNVAGTLLFSKLPSSRLPVYVIKAVSYPGTDIDVERYDDSQDIQGTIQDQFRGALSFVLRDLRHIQGDKNVNSEGDPEIPRVVFEELIANALIHRDYFVSAPIRIFVFADRIEIISPGHLPNNLTIENIKNGNSNIRNPILASHATKILPYRGLQSGISRALKAWPSTEFTDDRGGNLFKAVVQRPRRT